MTIGKSVIDAKNNPLYHFIVGTVSFVLIALIYLSGISLNRAFAGVAFFLLIMTLSTGPLTRMFNLTSKRLLWNFPWSWRGEFGIWFVVISLIHTLVVFRGHGNLIGFLSNMRSSELIALTGLLLVIPLAISSFSRVIGYIGIVNWKWMHKLSYVVFFLLSIHVIDYAFLRPGRPEDWLHWSYLIMILFVIFLQIVEFILMVGQYRRKVNES